MVEQAGLENQYASNGIVSSNLTLSAITPLATVAPTVIIN